MHELFSIFQLELSITYVTAVKVHHKIEILRNFNSKCVFSIKVDVGPYKETRIRAFGPGLISGIVNKPAVFVVETNGETGALGRHLKFYLIIYH